MSVSLREASSADAQAVASLLTQLGYPADAASTRDRLELMLPDERRAIVVAVTDGRIVGLAVGETGLVLNRPWPVARLALLVTDETVRGQGVGTALVRWFEDWARARGARHASLTSALHREQAHAFYRARGWEATGLRFGRELSWD